MHEVTDEFLAAIKQSHTVISKAIIRVPDGEDIELPVISGNVSVDSDAAVRRTCRATLADETGDLVPEDLHHIIAPRQTEFDIYRGIRLRVGPGVGFPISASADFTEGTHNFSEEDDGELRMVF